MLEGEIRETSDIVKVGSGGSAEISLMTGAVFVGGNTVLEIPPYEDEAAFAEIRLPGAKIGHFLNEKFKCR